MIVADFRVCISVFNSYIVAIKTQAKVNSISQICKQRGGINTGK